MAPLFTRRLQLMALFLLVLVALVHTMHQTSESPAIVTPDATAEDQAAEAAKEAEKNREKEDFSALHLLSKEAEETTEGDIISPNRGMIELLESGRDTGTERPPVPAVTDTTAEVAPEPAPAADGPLEAVPPAEDKVSAPEEESDPLLEGADVPEEAPVSVAPKAEPESAPGEEKPASRNKEEAQPEPVAPPLDEMPEL